VKIIPAFGAKPIRSTKNIHLSVLMSM